MKGVVIYSSRYGSTETYARWIGATLSLPVYNYLGVKAQSLENFDYFILGSPVYVGKMKIASWVKHNRTILHKKKLFLFTVCATPPGEKQQLIEILNKNFDADILNRAQTFFLHGKMIKSKLSFFDSFILKMGAQMQKDPEQRRKMLTDFDDVKEEYIAPLVNAVKQSVNTNKADSATSLLSE